MEERNIPVSVELAHEPHGQSVGLKECGCHGFCEMGPLVRIEPQGWLYTKTTLEDCEEIVTRTAILCGERIERLSFRTAQRIPNRTKSPFYQKQTRLVLEHCGQIDATSIREYLGFSGYAAFKT